MQDDILKLLPHRPPFVMIDSIRTEGGKAYATFKIEAGNVLVTDGSFSESGMVENMAQAAGAGLPQHADGTSPSLGFIGALKDLLVKQLPEVGETISTEITYLHQVMNAHIVQARVLNTRQELLASCELKIFLQK